MPTDLYWIVILIVLVVVGVVLFLKFKKEKEERAQRVKEWEEAKRREEEEENRRKEEKVEQARKKAEHAKAVEAAAAVIREKCKDKTDVERYEKIIKDENFGAGSEDVDAFMKVLVEDQELWGGDLLAGFVPTEVDDDFNYGFGVNVAYNFVVGFVCCGIRTTNPAIALVRHFFETRTSPDEKMDGLNLGMIETSLTPLYDAREIDQMYDVVEAFKTIPSSAWAKFETFYPLYKEIVEANDLVNALTAAGEEETEDE